MKIAVFFNCTFDLPSCQFTFYASFVILPLVYFLLSAIYGLPEILKSNASAFFDRAAGVALTSVLISITLKEHTLNEVAIMCRETYLENQSSITRPKRIDEEKRTNPR